jgi:hypothetical protein
MRRPPFAAARLGGAAAVAAILLASCGTSPSSEPAIPSGAAISSAAPSGSASSAAPSATPVAVATPQPTPQFTNPLDRELTAMIPDRAAGERVVVPPVDEFAYTPGDIAEAYGELGLRFTALQVAYVDEPRLSLFAMRAAPPEVTTRELEPYLEEAGRYVGIAGLVREPWKLRRIGTRVTWIRPEDNATALGTHIYTWAAGDVVFLMIGVMIGVDEEVNRALFRALPGEQAPSSTPSPSSTPTDTPSPTSSASTDPS